MVTAKGVTHVTFLVLPAPDLWNHSPVTPIRTPARKGFESLQAFAHSRFADIISTA
jgi:hypothetical protein